MFKLEIKVYKKKQTKNITYLQTTQNTEPQEKQTEKNQKSHWLDNMQIRRFNGDYCRPNNLQWDSI